MKVGMRCCYVVGRPPAKFHRIRSLFDAPTDNYSDIIVGQNVGRFRSPETVAGLHLSSLLSTQSFLHSPLSTTRPRNPLCTVHRTPRARPEVVPNPTWTVATVGLRSSPIIYKMSPFSYWTFLVYLFAAVQLRSEGRGSP